MKKLSKRLLAVMICIVFQFTMFQGIIVSGYTPAETENTKHVLVKYKKGTADSEKKVKDKKKDNKVKGYKKFRNVDAYSMEVDSSCVDELKNDPDIELVEEDSAIEKLDYQGDYKVTGNVLTDLYKNKFKTNQICECGCDSEENCTCSDCLANDCKGDDECKCSCTENEKAHAHAAEASESEAVVNNDDSNTTKTTSKGDKIGWNISAIGADKVHEKGVYGNGVKVAVFDSGIDLDNEDIGVVGGVSFVEGDTSYDDVNGHGTEMAAILASKENGIGLVGVAPEIQLYSVKILNQMGQGRYSSIIEGIDWAIENNIKIIAMSFGGYQNSVILREAIKKASDNNIVVIAASGNDGTNTICYPAAYQEVICVGAVDKSNVLASFSNIGRQMDLVAPGVEVETVNANGETFLATGTSSSVPHVAGAAALLLGEKSDLTNGQVKYLLFKNTIEKGPLELFGNGLVNVENSYENLLSGTYEEVIKDEDGDVIGQSDLDVGGDGIVHALGCGYCSCSASCWSSYGISYGAHTSSGHSTLYYCTAPGCTCFSCRYSGSNAGGPGAPGAAHPHPIYCTICSVFMGNGTSSTCCTCLGSHAPGTPGASPPHPVNCTRCGFFLYYGSLSNCCHCIGHNPSASYINAGSYHYQPCTRCNAQCNITNHYVASSNISPQHTTYGHYYTTSCICNAPVGSGYTTIGSCTYCTTPPTVSINTDLVFQNGFTSVNTSYIPSIKIWDNFGDTLTCQYYIDNVLKDTRTATPSNPQRDFSFTTAFNPSSLSVGEHTIKVIVTDTIGLSVTKIGKFVVKPFSQIYALASTLDEVCNMMFTATGITDFTKHTFKITYDPTKLDVVDLCSQTDKLDTTVGAVPGSNKSITTFNSSTGIIEFTMSNPSSLTRAWAGIVNSIKFKSKVTGNTNITYTIQ